MSCARGVRLGLVVLDAAIASDAAPSSGNRAIDHIQPDRALPPNLQTLGVASPQRLPEPLLGRRHLLPKVLRRRRGVGPPRHSRFLSPLVSIMPVYSPDAPQTAPKSPLSLCEGEGVGGEGVIPDSLTEEDGGSAVALCPVIDARESGRAHPPHPPGELGWVLLPSSSGMTAAARERLPHVPAITPLRVWRLEVGHSLAPDDRLIGDRPSLSPRSSFAGKAVR